MSASDAAPLPRLGEVFFDVRGHSRSMRLSWYADTGVAVFSIWQGGKCTGTFRLPIDDLPRMVEILQRGPESRRPRSGGGRPPGWEPPPGPEREYGPGYGDETAYVQETGYGQDYREDRRYAPDRDYGDDLEHGRDRGYSGGPDYGEAPNYGDDRGYSAERVVPPYVQGTSDPYTAGNFSTGSSDRASLGRPAYQPDRSAGPSPAGQYDEPPWSPAGYSDDPDYRLPEDRLPADQPPDSRHSAGRHPQR